MLPLIPIALAALAALVVKKKKDAVKARAPVNPTGEEGLDVELAPPGAIALPAPVVRYFGGPATAPPQTEDSYPESLGTPPTTGYEAPPMNVKPTDDGVPPRTTTSRSPTLSETITNSSIGERLGGFAARAVSKATGKKEKRPAKVTPPKRVP